LFHPSQLKVSEPSLPKKLKGEERRRDKRRNASTSKVCNIDVNSS